jgi:hypothetical protein
LIDAALGTLTGQDKESAVRIAAVSGLFEIVIVGVGGLNGKIVEGSVYAILET